MRILITGGRSFSDREALFHALHELAARHGWLTIIEGGATGADQIAREWAKLCYHGLVTIEAEWEDLSHPDAVIRTGRNGRKYDALAGPRRNQRMLVSGKPDLVLAAPGGTGTADCVARARRAGVEVIEIKDRHHG